MKRIIIIALLAIPFLGYGQLKEVQRGALNNSRAEHAINAGINQTNTNTADIATLETAEVDTTSLDNRININAAMLEDSLGWSGGFTTEAEAPYFLFYNPLTAAISYYDTTGWGGGAGGGFILGPAGAVTDRIVTFDGITGQLVQDGGNTIAEVLARSNHTGTQTASTVSDFDVEVANNTAVTANTAKTGITAQQASDIATNNAKVSYTDAAAVSLNTAKISYTDAAAVSLNTAKISYTDAAAVSLNTAKETNATHTSEVTGATDLTIADGVIEAVNIESTNVQSDGDVMTYDSGSGGFTWEANSAVDQEARDSTAANAEDIAANTSALGDTVLFTDYVYTKAEVDALIAAALLQTYPDSASWEDEYKAVFATYSTLPTNATATAINSFVEELKDSSYYSRIDGIWLLAGDYEDNCQVNMIYPDSAITLVGDPTWTTDGYTGQYTPTTYINTGWGMLDNASAANYSLNDLSLGIYIQNNLLAAYSAVGADDGTDDIFISPRWTADQWYGRANSQGSVGGSNSDSRGWSLVTRTESASQQGSLNGGYDWTDTDVSTAIPDANLMIGARYNGVATAYTISLVILMDGLAEWETNSVYGIVQGLMEDLGIDQ